MKDADWDLLSGLRLVSDLTEAEWDIVIADVEKAGGVRQVGGQARVEIQRAVAKARSMVVKHPGHPDQSVHGGKGKGGGKAPASEAPTASSARAHPDADPSTVLNDPKFKEAHEKLQAEVGRHQQAIDKSNLSREAKNDAQTELARMEDVVTRMKSAKTMRQLEDLRVEATDLGENYKGTVRNVDDMRRRRHYASGRGWQQPYQGRSLLQGLDEASLQDLADRLPVPNTYDD